MNRWRWSSLLLIAAAFELGGGSEVYANDRNRRNDRCYAVRVRAADSESRTRRSARFSAAAVKDLVIEVSVSDAAASRPVQVKLFTPSGRLYQVIDARAEESRTAAREGRRGRRRSLSAHFPVAGTHVTTYALFGKWRAETYLDGAETPCARPREFVIER